MSGWQIAAHADAWPVIIEALRPRVNYGPARGYSARPGTLLQQALGGDLSSPVNVPGNSYRRGAGLMEKALGAYSKFVSDPLKRHYETSDLVHSMQQAMVDNEKFCLGMMGDGKHDEPLGLLDERISREILQSHQREIDRACEHALTNHKPTGILSREGGSPLPRPTYPPTPTPRPDYPRPERPKPRPEPKQEVTQFWVDELASAPDPAEWIKAANERWTTSQILADASKHNHEVDVFTLNTGQPGPVMRLEYPRRTMGVHVNGEYLGEAEIPRYVVFPAEGGMHFADTSPFEPERPKL